MRPLPGAFLRSLALRLVLIPTTGRSGVVCLSGRSTRKKRPADAFPAAIRASSLDRLEFPVCNAAVVVRIVCRPRVPKVQLRSYVRSVSPSVARTEAMNILQPFNTVFFVGLVVYFWIRHGFMEQTKGQKKKVRRVDTVEKVLLAAMFLPVLVLPLIYFFTPLLSFADYHLPWFVLCSGVVVMVTSLWLFRRSHVDLGLNWSVSLEIRKNHTLICHGVYRLVRHPMYTSTWMWAISQGMLLQNWFVGWAVVPAFAAMYFIRMPREERLMVETFGDDYRRYTRQTGRLFPRLRKAAEQLDERETSASSAPDSDSTPRSPLT